MLISGRSRDGEVEIIELKEHPFYIGVQFHPEKARKMDFIFKNFGEWKC